MSTQYRTPKQHAERLLFWALCVANVCIVSWLWTNLPPVCPKAFLVALVCMSVSVVGTMVSRITGCLLWWASLARWHAILLIGMLLLIK
jgi:hypothetical protein